MRVKVAKKGRKHDIQTIKGVKTGSIQKKMWIANGDI
jgi:hypothetical protein